MCSSPGGATGCSHGWSERRQQATAAQPVESVSFPHIYPEGAEGSAPHSKAKAGSDGAFATAQFLHFSSKCLPSSG